MSNQSLSHISLTGKEYMPKKIYNSTNQIEVFTDGDTVILAITISPEVFDEIASLGTDEEELDGHDGREPENYI